MAIPTGGVIAIVEADPLVGRIIVNQFDFYVYHSGGWYGHDIAGLWQWLKGRGIVEFGRFVHTWAHEGEAGSGDIFGLFEFLAAQGLVYFGEVVSNALYLEILNLAINDPEFPPKSAYMIGEKRP